MSSEFQAVVEITLIGDAGPHEPVEVVLDTGFQGYLVLPANVIRELGLQYPEEETVVLADGQRVQLSSYIATAVWHDRHRLVIVLEGESTPLMGTFSVAGQPGYFGYGSRGRGEYRGAFGLTMMGGDSLLWK